MVVVFVVLKPGSASVSTKWLSSFLIENLAEMNVAKRKRRRQLLRGPSLQTYDTAAIDSLQGIPDAIIDWKE